MSRIGRRATTATLAGLLIATLFPSAVLGAAPDAVDDPTNPVVEDVATTLDILGNDLDPDVGDVLTITDTTDGAKGVVTITNDGADVLYDPDLNATGVDTFTYTISDGAETDSATVTVQISSVNDDPVANSDPTNPIVEDITTSLDVLGNDTDPDGDSLTISDATDGAKGVVTITNDGAEVSYDPDVNATGSDTFTYTISDGTDTDSAIVTVQISSVNDPPDAVDDPTNPIVEDITATLDVLANDSDPDTGDSFLITSRTNGAKGAVIITNGGADVSYDPSLNATGSDTFTYTISDGTATDTATVTVQIGAANDGPDAVDDPTNPIVEDVTAALDVLTNDTDADGDTFAITSRTNGAKGAVSIINGGGGLSYDPDLNATGTDTFTYTISDGNGGTDTATVTVQISAVNDPPVANADTHVVGEDSGAATVAVMGNDTDPDAGETLTITGRTDPAHGTLTLVSGVLRYTPDANYSGSDDFEYTISDGEFTDSATVSITVTPVNDPPSAIDDTTTVDEDSGPGTVVVLDNDTDVDGPGKTVVSKTDPDHGTLTLVSGVLTYTPTTDYFGPDSFSYTMSDGTLQSTATVTITVTPVNDDPDAVDESVTIPRDTGPNALNVLFNDTDLESDPLLITAKTNGTKGTVAITGGGTGLTYDPFTGFSGADSFTYTVDDGNGGTDTATVSVTIAGANRAPNAVNDVGISVPEGSGATTLDVLGNDDDPDGDTIAITARTDPPHGTVVIADDGSSLTYDPDSLFYGTDSFTYTVRDLSGAADTATVVVTVVRDSAAPTVIVPYQRFIGQTVGSSSIKSRIAWSASDPGSGVKSYQLQVSVSGRTYATVALPSATRTYIDRVHAYSATYRYRVRATDREGNVSAWRYSQTFRPALFQETTALATYVGSWTTYPSTRALGRGVRYTSSVGRSAQFRATAYDIALVMTKTATSGSADVYVDGVLATRINLRASSSTYRQLVYARHFTTLGLHTIEVRPVGNGRVDVDAFAVLR